MRYRIDSKWASKPCKALRPLGMVSRAIAVNYSAKHMNAPEVTAKGSNIIASEMKAIAKRFAIPIYQSKNIADKLSKVDVSSQIPRDLYEDISKVFLSIESIKAK